MCVRKFSVHHPLRRSMDSWTVHATAPPNTTLTAIDMQKQSWGEACRVPMPEVPTSQYCACVYSAQGGVTCPSDRMGMGMGSGSIERFDAPPLDAPPVVRPASENLARTGHDWPAAYPFQTAGRPL
jgi:hypothetical protein